MKAVNTYLKKRKRRLNLLLIIPGQKFTPDIFHQLRVELKKLNAIFRLVNACSDDFKYKKTFKPFEDILNQAGKVRELQLEEALMKKYFPAPAVKDYRLNLKNSRLEERTSFFTLIHQITLPELEQKYHQVQSHLSGITRKKAKKYLQEKQKAIENLLHTPVLQPVQVHELRKALKEYNYSRKCLDMDDLFKSFPYQDKLTLLLGKWHDGRVIVRHLTHVMESNTFIPKEMKQLQKIKEKIYAQNEILLIKINALRC